MRRDLVYFYPLPINQVYDAFTQGANQKFGKSCKFDPYKTLSFALNFSFKYNMNGGSLTAHFMPYQNGTAVDLRYTIVQAVGARYKAHARDYILFINGILRAQGTLINIPVQQFLDYEARTPSMPRQNFQPAQPQMPPQPAPQQQMPVQPPQQQAPAPQQQMPVQQQAPMQQQAPVQPAPQQQASRGSFCTKCGAPATPGAAFCTKCGNKLS